MQISLNNGCSYTDAPEAMPEIERRNLWPSVVVVMDTETREAVCNEIAPCTDVEFLQRYLETAPCDLVVG